MAVRASSKTGSGPMRLDFNRGVRIEDYAALPFVHAALMTIGQHRKPGGSWSKNWTRRRQMLP
jgi:hypothetical protein